MGKLAASVLIGLLAIGAFHALAQGRIDVRPTLTAVGTSSSNGVSFAWFFDPQNRTVHICRTGQDANAPLECKASALPVHCGAPKVRANANFPRSVVGVRLRSM